MRRIPAYRAEQYRCDICGYGYFGSLKPGETDPIYKKIWEKADPDTTEPSPEVEPYDRAAFRIEGKTLREYVGTMSEVFIPRGVERIGREAFMGNKNVERVVLPDTVKIVGEQVFGFCESLKEIVLNDGLEMLCRTSIWACGVEELSVPDSVAEIGLDAFGACRNLKRVRLPADIKELPGYLFAGCKCLESVHISASVQNIGLGLLSGCNGLKELTVDSDNPRYNAEGLCLLERGTGVLVAGCASSVIPDGVKTIGAGAFENSALTELRLPESVEVIGLSAFSHCNALAEVILPPHVRVLDYHAFEECENLKRIFLPKSVTTIFYDAFFDCKQLTFYVEETEEEWYKKVKGDYWCWKRPVVWGYKP